MNKTICFISNYYKTYLFKEVAKSLEAAGVKVFWITNDKKYFDLLVEDYGEDKVLNLTWRFAEEDNLEVGQFKLNEIIYSDRVLVKQKTKAKKYLQNIQKPIYDFINNNEITSVFGEITWGHELLIQRICNSKPELNCNFYNPHTIRKPFERFGFFTDESQSVLAKGKELSVEEMDLDRINEVPTYLNKNNEIQKKKNSIKGYSKRVLDFTLNKNHDDESDPTRHPKSVIVKLHAKEMLNRISYKQVKTISLSQFSDKKYVFYGFHKQPESSIDVIGRYYEDQFEIIKNIWRVLDSDTLLILKEHTNAVGDRSVEFYKRCLELDGVIIAKETESAAEIIKKSLGVFTISGTIGLEAMLFNIPAFTFADAFFNGYGKCTRLNIEDLKANTLKELISKANSNQKTVEDFKEMLQDHSFDGIIGDFMHTDGVMELKNIQNLTKAFLSVI